ncbi:Polysaccharide pyruvyl transferase family protein WcaK [Rhodovulum sp. ES.010]|uniref:polysaccharide pyruvyl transferase family protein n=1 Tax=Rhodovulum sp. ES.010 TaxID=1882821 RepID=UPI00092742E4|nr:polysaccharide pyruvyl transferase family protein [Rhodovulum sp. ES.010]SIO59884.1 Polysaccharide pyruvyl transferase family protein WcaK [Rhodovulum sp. ES.010]
MTAQPSGSFGFVSPTGPGSLGDQAMLDAATAHAIAAGHRAAVFPHAPALRSGARVFHGRGRLGVAAATARGLWAASHAVYIGADVLDGVYYAKSSLKRLNTLRAAHLLGRRTRVMGSSWSTTPAPEVIAFLKAASWLEILARDPVSRGRMEADLGREVRLAADLGFLLRPEAKSPAAQAATGWAAARKTAGATVLAANLSGHTIRTLPGASVAPFAGLIARWLEADPARGVVIVPHDTRPGLGGDLGVCADLAAALKDRFADRLHVPLGPLDAWDAKAIAGAVDLVLTGRMHFAIAALGQGTPPVSFVYQGKFEGLMQHFGLESEGLMLASDADGTGAPGSAALEAATARAADLRRRIETALPRVVALARSNFEGF